MAVAVYHFTRQAMRTHEYDLIERSEEAAAKKILEGFRLNHFYPVAVIPTDDLEVAWTRTNNIDTAWDQADDVEVYPLQDDWLYGKPEHHRSSRIGDVFVDQDGVHVAASFGFIKLFDLSDPRWIEVTENMAEKLI